MIYVPRSLNFGNIYPWCMLIVQSSHLFRSWICKWWGRIFHTSHDYFSVQRITLYFFIFQLPPSARCHSLYNLPQPKVGAMNNIIAYMTPYKSCSQFLPLLRKYNSSATGSPVCSLACYKTDLARPRAQQPPSLTLSNNSVPCFGEEFMSVKPSVQY